MEETHSSGSKSIAQELRNAGLIRHLSDWLDDRLGHRGVLRALRQRALPAGPSWWLTSAACLFWLLVLQCVTGLLLMASYSPSMASAWASVQFIDQTSAGRFLRGVHHFTPHAMIVLFGVHVARVLIAASFRAPRELIWITGLLLIPLVILWTVTGNPLSGSQTGMAQIEVEGNILGSMPLLGRMLQRILIGGDEIGNLTLTHLYFLHVGLFPLLVGLLLAIHLQQVYRHNVVSADARWATDTHGSQPGAVTYWPYQTARNQVVMALVTAAIFAVAWTRGAPLDAPADASIPHSPRPEWYFRWIFELRRHFSGDWEFVATILVPTAILAFFLAVPLVNRSLSKRLGLLFRATLMFIGLSAWSYLTWVSFARDWHDEEFVAEQRQFDELSQRARQLADVLNVPLEGAQHLLSGDARTQGPLLFRQHCASCHSHVDARGQGIAATEPSAPNLDGFGTSEWILGMLEPKRIVSPQVFGHTKFRDGEMIGKIQGLFDEAGADGAAQLQTELREVARALSAEAALAGQRDRDRADAAAIARGRELITGKLSCTDCHHFYDAGELGSAPDLTGYGSREWLLGMIANPTGERYYGGELNDRMPCFAPDSQRPHTNLLSPTELAVLVDWLRCEWFEPSAKEGE